MHSNYLTVWRLLILATVTTFGNGETIHIRNRMQIGVHITYNHELQEMFQTEKRDPNYYFTVLVNAVETRLATIPDVTLELTLVGTNAINESDAIENSTMEKKDIFKNFKNYYTTNRFKLGCPDATFYVTMAYFMESAQDEASWLYTAKLEGLCGEDSMGMFYDDGKSFYGVHALSRELAFLIGATRDNDTYEGCRKSDGYLTSLLDDTTMFRLSRCAMSSVYKYFLQNQNYNCWNDTPKSIMKNNWTLPSQYLKEYLTDGRLDMCEAQLFYLELKTCRKYTAQRPSVSCRVFCCEEGTVNRIGYVVEADGRECGRRGDKMCIHGECLSYY